MIGELDESKQLEWKIPSYSSLSRSSGLWYKSPSFNFANVSWHLSISPETPEYPYILVRLNKEIRFPPCIFFSACIKKWKESSTSIDILEESSTNVQKLEGSSSCINKLEESMKNIKKFEESGTQAFTRNSMYKFGFEYFLDACILERDKINLLPSDILTIICNLKSGVKGEEIIDLVKQPTNSEVETLILAETDVLSNNFKDLFINQDCCDAVLQVQDKEFKAHRTVLIARSTVFAGMFKHHTSEKQAGIINIPDCDAETFQQFLEYLYLGKLENISFDSAVNLYITSDKYDVKELKTFCAKYMIQNLTVENVCDVVILADKYDEEMLFSVAQEFFNENFKQIVKTCEWASLLKNNYRLANKLLIEMSESKG